MTVLFVVATIILFLSMDWISRRLRQEATQPAREPAPALPFARTPEGIYFTPSHTWLNLFPSGKVRLGIDDFITRMLDAPEITLLKKSGDAVKKGDPVLLLAENGRRLTVRSPIDAEVVEPNDALPAHPRSLRDALFSDGWAYLLKPRRTGDLKGFSLGAETGSWMQTELGRLRDFFASARPNGELVPALQDGGPPVAGALKAMDDAAWSRFEEEFLGVPSDERTGQ